MPPPPNIVQRNDPTREMRAMYMVAFPCPPLPVICFNLTGRRICNSHDFLGFLLDVAMRRNDEAENFKRAEQQADLIDSYFSAEHNGDFESLERAMQGLTRAWLGTFCDKAHGLEFLPLADCDTKVRTQVQHWLAAQHIALGEEKSATDFDALGLKDLYTECYQQRLRVNTVENTS